MSIEFKIEVESIGESGDVDAGANQCMFVRKADTLPFSVNGYPLSEGESFGVSGESGEVDKTKYKLLFTDDSSGNEQIAYVIRKNYIKS